MPRDGSNVMSKPAGTAAVSGTTIESAKYNSTIDDIIADLNLARPIVAGGTGSSTAAGARTALGIAIGANVQAYDADLTAIAALTSAADKVPYATGAGTWALADLSAAGRALIGDANAAAQLTTLGAQPLDADLTALAALSTTGLLSRTAANTFAARQITSTDSSVTITNPGGVAGDIDLSIPASGTVAAQTTSGAASYDFTVPSTVNEITIQFSSVSVFGSDNILVQLGDSGGIETSGYTSTSNTLDSTTGFIIAVGLGSRAATGLMTLSRVGVSEQWIASHSVALMGERSSGGGSKTLSAAITTVRIAATGATTFDGGSVALRYR